MQGRLGDIGGEKAKNGSSNSKSGSDALLGLRIMAQTEISSFFDNSDGLFVRGTQDFEFKKMLAAEAEEFTPETILTAQRYHRIM